MFRNPTTDLIVVLAIVLLIWGPKRLPGLGRQLGQGIREFRDSITGRGDEDEQGQQPAQLPQSGATTPPAGVGAERQSAAEVSSTEPRA